MTDMAAMNPATETCPGCVGRGTGTRCCACGLPIPVLFLRSAASPPEFRAGCADCRAGRPHPHIQPAR